MSGERERVKFMIRVVVSFVRRLFCKVESTTSSADELLDRATLDHVSLTY